MKKITKKELNERLKEIKEKYFDHDEKIIYKAYHCNENILLMIKTVDKSGLIYDYSFYNEYDHNGEILVMRYMYTCDIKNGIGLYL